MVMVTLNTVADDRRANARFDIVGSLRGALELDEPARILEITDGGALLESRLPIPIGPLTIELTIDDRVTQPIAARVHQVRRANDAIDTSPYLISILFLSDVSSYVKAIRQRF